MRDARVSPIGVVLITVNWLFANAILFEYFVVQDLLFAPDVNWQDTQDSGVVALVSFPVNLGVVPAAAVLVALVVLVIRLVRTTALGWVSLAGHVALLATTWNGQATSGSSMDYWARLALLAACAATGIVAGANIRPRHQTF